MELNARKAHIYREGAAIQVKVPRIQPEPVRLLPLCDRLGAAPGLTAVLGLEQGGTPLLLRLPAPEVAHVLVAGTAVTGENGAGAFIVASLAMHDRQGAGCRNQPERPWLWPAGWPAAYTRARRQPLPKPPTTVCVGWWRRWSGVDRRGQTAPR